MDHYQVSLLIHRIGCGKFYFIHQDIKYTYKQPTYDIKYQSELIYHNYLENNKYDISWNKDNISKVLSYLKLWSDDDDNQLIKIEKQIDNLKLDIYNERLRKEKILKLKDELNRTREYYNKMLTKKHYLDYLTIEDCAGSAKNEFIMINSIYQNDNLVFSNTLSDIESTLFNSLASCIASNFISIEDYKIVARSEQWKAIWNSNKHNIFFGKSAYELSDEQKTLISISNMYDKIYEHPECPEDYVIADDDMLDGWMIYQRNKSEKNKKENMANELANKHKNAKEIFVVADKDDVSSIMELNSGISSSIIKQRKSVIKNSQDGVDEVNLPDVQMELLQKVNKR